MYKRLILALILLTCFHNFVKAASFDSFGIGTRALGMGSAFTAVADDDSALFYNPAGLVNLRDKQVMASYYNMYEGDLLSNAFFGLGIPFLGPGTFAFGWNRVSVNGQQMLSGFNENVVTTAYGFNFIPHLSLGVDFRFLGAFYGNIKGLGYGLGLSGLYNYKNIVFLGMDYEDINNPRIYWDTGLIEDIQGDLRVGISAKPLQFLLLSLDLDQLNQDNINVYIGTEITPFESKVVFLRGGLIFMKEQSLSFTLGAGINIRHVQFDFTFYQQASLGISDILGISFEF